MNNIMDSYRKTLNRKSKFFEQDMDDFWKVLLRDKNNLKKLNNRYAFFNMKFSNVDIRNNCDVSFIK